MIWKKDIATTENSGAAIAFLAGDSKSFLVSDWNGWLYLYQGEAPDWKLRQKFRLGSKVVYMVCPSRTGWWAALPFGDKAGLWTVPESDIERTAQSSKTPAEYCSTSDDGRMTAVLNATGIEVKSNSTGGRETAYYFANQSATVAIQAQPPMVMTEVNGKLMAWPLPGKELSGIPRSAVPGIVEERYSPK